MIFVVTIVFSYFTAISGGPVLTTEKVQQLLFNNTRRILNGHDVTDTRPYMVYLMPGTSVSPDDLPDPNWFCGGVIIHERYILTSAACIENVKQFYVVSGTHRLYGPTESNDCLTNGAKKAIWKCVPKSYVFDGNEFDNIRWMVNDIAVVKVDEDFNFKKRVRGCDFIPKMIAYNNKTDDMERAGSRASIAGWGADDKFASDILGGQVQGGGRSGSTSLKESDAVIISQKNCKKRWPERYHYIIEKSMICTKDSSSDMSSVCTDNIVNCKELVYSDEELDVFGYSSTNSPYLDKTLRRMMPDLDNLTLHGAHHHDTRRMKIASGGFCENDHGGPLIVGQGKSSVVVGVISACQTRDLTHKCYGPFLYTSVYRNRDLINCAINKDIIATCRMLLRSRNTEIEKTYMSWGHSGINRAKLREKKVYDVAVTTTTSTSVLKPASKFASKPVKGKGKEKFALQPATELVSHTESTSESTRAYTDSDSNEET